MKKKALVTYGKPTEQEEQDYGSKIFLAEGRDPADFYEISREEYERITEEQEAMNDAPDVRG